MSNLKTNNQNKAFRCYNCETEIEDLQLKKCPNCGIILAPNNYVHWRNSFSICLCLLCLIPILIVIAISIPFS